MNDYEPGGKTDIQKVGSPDAVLDFFKPLAMSKALEEMDFTPSEEITLMVEAIRTAPNVWGRLAALRHFNARIKEVLEMSGYAQTLSQTASMVDEAGRQLTMQSTTTRILEEAAGTLQKVEAGTTPAPKVTESREVIIHDKSGTGIGPSTEDGVARGENDSLGDGDGEGSAVDGGDEEAQVQTEVQANQEAQEGSPQEDLPEEVKALLREVGRGQSGGNDPDPDLCGEGSSGGDRPGAGVSGSGGGQDCRRSSRVSGGSGDCEEGSGGESSRPGDNGGQRGQDNFRVCKGGGEADGEDEKGLVGEETGPPHDQGHGGDGGTPGDGGGEDRHDGGGSSDSEYEDADTGDTGLLATAGGHRPPTTDSVGLSG